MWLTWLRSSHRVPISYTCALVISLGGRADLIELCRIFEKENPALPMRVDHGMTFTDEPGGIMDESSHGHNAGYTLLGRMFALGQVQGILATVDRELGIEYKQPGFFD